MAASFDRDSRIWAVLGPTNTGKTHLAIERMLGHPSGVIGLPLRLLAREVYDRIVRARGVGSVALITGEEKIAPETARYTVATVEAMPVDKRVSFVAVDEIQLASDPDRGHIFTDRLLRARGEGETLFLGSDTVRPLIRAIIPGIDIDRRERLSRLHYAGPKKITKLPKRTAIVAFSAEEVYAIAELIRRHRGGAAVVMGALSPRTRNAQVELYQSGEVDFLVATDAIGMGLNMDVDHVAFASLAKFDGRRSRRLRADELAQIAGRAGRYITDGTFGETGDCEAIEAETVERVEAHTFEPLETLEWRTAEISFASLDGLIASLDVQPPAGVLRRARGSSDEETFKRLAAKDWVRERVRGGPQVRRLWEACQLPDFRKVTLDEHVRLVDGIAEHLLSRRGRIPEEWIATRIEALTRTDGDLDALQARLAHIRTWAYAATRPDWIINAPEWSARTKAVENTLSDTLHERLTQRFIDRRTSALLKGLKREDALLAGVNAVGEVTVEGHHVGRLIGLSFVADPRAVGLEERALRNAALRALRPELAKRLGALTATAAETLSLNADGFIHWGGDRVGRLVPNSPTLAPRISLVGGELGPIESQKRAVAGLEAWLGERISVDLQPLCALNEAVREGRVAGLARGIAFQLGEAFGAVARRAVADDLDRLSANDRRALRSLGIRFGRESVFLPALLKPKPAAFLSLLRHYTRQAEPDARLFIPPPGANSIKMPVPIPDPVLSAGGYRAVGGRAIRLDALEAFLEALHAAPGLATPQGGGLPDAAASLIGARANELPELAKALGFRRVRIGQKGEGDLWRVPRPRSNPGNPETTHQTTSPIARPNSPFAALAILEFGPPTSSPANTRDKRPPRRKRARPKVQGTTKAMPT